MRRGSESVIRDATRDKPQGKKSESVIWDATGEKPQGKKSESIIQDAIEDKPQDKGANLSPGTQPETNRKANERICHLGRNRRQIARQDCEYVIRDTTGDKS